MNDHIPPPAIAPGAVRPQPPPYRDCEVCRAPVPLEQLPGHMADHQLAAEAEAAQAAAEQPDPAPEDLDLDPVEIARYGTPDYGRPRLPELIHSGTYALWRTPAGLYHLTYRRTAGTNPASGQIEAIEGAPDVHMRDLPEHAAQMVTAVMDRDQDLPPLLETFLFGGGNPLAAGNRVTAMRQIAGLVKEAGGLDQLIDFAQQQNGGQPDAGPVE